MRCMDQDEMYKRVNQKTGGQIQCLALGSVRENLPVLSTKIEI